jgi:UDP-N-acetylmuramate--alanine ligase
MTMPIIQQKSNLCLEGVNEVYKGYEKVCIFQPHRISRLKDLKKDFTYAFKNAG